MKALVVNCSAPHYNLGAQKLAAWLSEQGHTVEMAEGDPGLYSFGFDLVALSVIFSWHAPIALEVAHRVKANAEVWCGGPGMAALGNWWRSSTGLESVMGLDSRFERQHGSYRMTFASRGCPVGCWFCIVPRIEGRNFTLYWDFDPAPILCDNNLSALPAEFQDHIIRRYQETGTKLGDANSGFEPRAFTEETFARWSGILTGKIWRFAFDEQAEREDVKKMMRILEPIRARLKRVYVLIGNEPIASCYDRAMQVIAWGGEPYCQYVRPLNWLGDPDALRHRHDWTEQLGRDFSRYFNAHVHRSVPIAEYKPRVNEPPPFARL